MDKTRERLEELIRQRGDDYLGLSKLLGRNAAYIQQFMKRGTPRKLDEDDRRTLARYFGVDESELGAPAPEYDVTMVPRLVLGASAGPGGLSEDGEAAGRFGFDPAWLRKLGAKPDALSIIQVQGDSMTPTLQDGDDIMVDRNDAGAKLRNGIYVIRVDDTLMVKRLKVGAKKAHVKVLSDNEAYPPIEESKTGQIEVIGRVVWAGRKVG
jgi:phage repressor protein C with HTH and peptisase S24 domain